MYCHLGQMGRNLQRQQHLPALRHIRKAEGKQKAMAGKPGKKRCTAGEWSKRVYELEYQGAKAKAPPCSGSTLQTLLPQQSLSSAREEDHWVVMEDRRRRRIAFENLAKGMLRYLDISSDVKVGITELQERLEVQENSVFLFGKWPSRR